MRLNRITTNSAVKLIGTSLTFSNNSVHHSGSKGFEFDYSGFEAISNNTIDNNALHAMELPATAINTIGTGNTFTCASGYGIDVNSGDISTPITWKKQTVSYYINVGININANLTIEEETILKFGSSGTIDVGYSNNAVLTAVGSTINPIIFTSSATTPAAGVWEGINLWDNSDNTIFDYCEFQYAGKGSSATRAAIKSFGSTFTVSNSKFKFCGGWGVYNDANTVFTNTSNTFEACNLGTVGFD
ncbi:MAG: right-handed parallel beta-helix repeat-containing protein [Bacteroidales bacterium]|nr:right-handed parallel beta-helix repeat-containing protein [Bacteroidales bacterium]